jgi:hypothetical protein
MQHLDEGTIHAWLDGQLPLDEAAAVEAHVAECRQCADAVAEARGLIAASSRILTALDGVPRDVAPQTAISHQPSAISREGAAEPPARRDTPAIQRARRRWFSAPSLAAAATIVVAVGTFTLMRTARKDATMVAPQPTATVERALGSSADTQSFAAATAAPPPAASPAPAAGNAAASANEIRPAAELGERRALADGARREADRVSPSRPAAPEPAPVVARSQVAPDSVAVKQSIASARANLSQLPMQGATEAKDQQRSATDQRDEQLSKVRQDVAAARRPKPDTATVTIFRGRELAQRKFQTDSAGAKVAAKAAEGVATTGTIRGRVTDGNNTGLESAVVTVMATSIGVTTAASGQFELSGVPTGTHRVLARRIGFTPSAQEITVAAGQAVTADFRLSAAQSSLENVVTGAVSAQREGRLAPAAPAPAVAPPQGQLVPTAFGCYDLSITPATAQARSGFREVPRSIVLDSTVVPSRADGVWYQVRNTARTGGTAGDGVWRPTTPDGVEVQWTFGSRTATLRLTGVPGPVLRGSAEEIDRATAVGEAGVVVAAKVRCVG